MFIHLLMICVTMLKSFSLTETMIDYTLAFNSFVYVIRDQFNFQTGEISSVTIR